MVSQELPAGVDVDTCVTDEDGERPLKLVVGYTDTFGRASCGTSETEHYRVRTLALVQARSSTSTIIENCNQKIKRLETWIREKRKGDAQATEVTKEDSDLCDIPGDMTVRTALRMITTTIEERRLHQTKLSRLDLALELVLNKYIALSHQSLIYYIHKLLPQEVLDLIYNEVVGQSKLIEILASEPTVAMNRTYDLPLDSEYVLRRWYFDPRIMGERCASGLMRVFFGKCIFRLEADEQLGHQLQGLSPAHSVPIAPQACLNEVILRIPKVMFRYDLDGGQSKWEGEGKELAQNLKALKNLAMAKAIITLDFRKDMNGHRVVPTSDFDPRRCLEPHEAHTNDDLRPHGCPDRPYAVNAKGLAKRSFVSTILEDLAPLISELLLRGHTVAVIDKNPCERCNGRIERLRNLEVSRRDV